MLTEVPPVATEAQGPTFFEAQPPAQRARRQVPPACACVGLPVQYVRETGEVLPATLQRKGHDGNWDLKVDLAGVMQRTQRTAVPYSEQPEKGRHSWNLLPGWPG